MSPPYAKLFIFVDTKYPELCEKYVESIKQHNQSIWNKTYPDTVLDQFSVEHNPYPNAGFDVFFPEEYVFNSSNSVFASMGIKCEMRILDTTVPRGRWIPTSYYSYPRSSISKTPLMLANSVGIIDSGYRGPIIGAFRNISSEQQPYIVEKNSRLLQLCAPDLRPIIVQMVDESFFETTERGDGGFGSTGK